MGQSSFRLLYLRETLVYDSALVEDSRLTATFLPADHRNSAISSVEQPTSSPPFADIDNCVIYAEYLHDAFSDAVREATLPKTSRDKDSLRGDAVMTLASAKCGAEDAIASVRVGSAESILLTREREGDDEPREMRQSLIFFSRRKPVLTTLQELSVRGRRHRAAETSG